MLPRARLQDAQHRFITDDERDAWNDKETPDDAQDKADGALEEAVRRDGLLNRDILPIGSIILWPGGPDNLPAGYLLCNGMTIGRYSTGSYYNELDSKLADFGYRIPPVAKAGRSLPDLRSKFIVPDNQAGLDYTLPKVVYIIKATEVRLSRNDQD